MTDADFAQAQRQRDEQTPIALYEQRAQAQARERNHDDELERAERGLERATAGSRVPAMVLKTVEHVVQLHPDAMSAGGAAISPIQRLPPELLLKIFYSLRDSSSARCQRSFVVASVCNRWRRLALASPRLWSIMLDFGHRTEHIAAYVKAVLVRSGNSALRITLISPRELRRDLMHTLDRVLPDAITQAGDLTIIRWGGRSSQNLSDTIYKFLQLPTLQLRRLYLYGFDFQTGGARLLPAAPLIASLDCCYGGVPQASLPSLHEISLMRQHESLDLAFLHATAPHLRRLTFNRYPDCRILRVPESTTLPHLEFLELDGVDILFLFSNDGLPALTHLIMRDLRAGADEPLSLPAMPLLREITLQDTEDWLSILPTFRHLQQVETLVLSWRDFVSPRMHAFWTQWAQRNHIEALPNLREITINGPDRKRINKLPGLVEFLEARTALSADDTTAVGKLPLLTLKNTALPRWELLRLEGAVERIAFVDD